MVELIADISILLILLALTITMTYGKTIAKLLGKTYD